VVNVQHSELPGPIGVKTPRIGPGDSPESPSNKSGFLI
jgi:hypothetical protein